MTAVGILPVVGALARLLEPDDEILEVAGKAPEEWAHGRLYVYPTRIAEVPFETGPGRRQDFALAAVFLGRSGEAALRQTDEELDALLDELRARYFEAVRHHPRTELWAHLQAAEARPPRTVDARGVALDITGWRLVQ